MAQLVSEARRAVLIIGGSGFLGSHLAQACVLSDMDLYGVDRHPPLDRSLWSEFTVVRRDENVDYRALLADRELSACFFLGGSASAGASLTNPYTDFMTVVPTFVHLLDYIRSYQSCAHVLLFSTAAVYGEVQHSPLLESQRAMPITPYGAHKLLAEEVLRSYSRIYGLTGSVLRVFSAYGAYNRRMLLWDLLEKWRAAERARETTIPAHGTGNESRDFVHASDVARAAIVVSGRPERGETRIINVGSGRAVKIKEVAEILLRGLPYAVSVRFSGEVRRGDPVQLVADTGRLSAMGHQPAIPLEAGLKEYTEWWAAHRDKIPSLRA